MLRDIKGTNHTLPRYHGGLGIPNREQSMLASKEGDGEATRKPSRVTLGICSTAAIWDTLW